MTSIEILGSGRIDERESAFPQAVQILNGDVLCSFSVGGGAGATGGTNWARSNDGGQSWTQEGTLLPATTAPHTTNSLKLCLSPHGGTIYAYRIRSRRGPGDGTRPEPTFCRSTDGGLTWSPPRVIPQMTEDRMGASHGILALSSGRLLAPAVLLPPGRLGEREVAAVSDDAGETWPSH